MFRRFMNWYTEANQQVIAHNEEQREFMQAEIIDAMSRKKWDRAKILQGIYDDRFRR